MEQVCDTSHGEAPVKAWIQILQKKDIQGFSGDFLAAAQMCEQITKYSSIGEKTVEMAQRLASNAANPTILWLVSRGSAVGVGLGMIQRYGAEVAKANKEYQELQVLVKDIDKDLSFTFQALAKKGGVTMPEPIKESIEHLIGVLHNCARKLKDALSQGYGKWLVKKLWGMSNTKEIGEMRSQLKDAKINVTWKFVCQKIAERCINRGGP